MKLFEIDRDKKNKRISSSLDSKLEAKKDEREKKKILNLKKLLDSISDKNEKTNSDNEKLNKNLFQLTNLLRVKDSELEIYKKNKNFMNFFQKFKFNKFARDKLRMIFISRIGKYLNEYKLKELFFSRWINKIKINLNLERRNERKIMENKIQNFSISKFQNFYLTKIEINKNTKNFFTEAKLMQIFKSENFLIEKKSVIRQFTILKNENFHLEKKSIIKQFTILKNENFHLVSNDRKNYPSPKSFLIYKILYQKFQSQIIDCKNYFFRNLLKFSNFKSIQKNLILFKNILLNKKLKFIIQNKSKLEKKFYFGKYLTQIKKKFIPKQENKILLKHKENFFSIISKQNHSSVLKYLIQKISLKHNERISSTSRNLFTLWKLQVKKSKLLEQDLLIADYKLITQDFTSKFITVEKTFTSNLIRIEELESDGERKDEELSELKSELAEKIEKINLLEHKFQISNSKDIEITSIKEKINSLHYNYETELEYLKEENSDLKIQLEELEYLKEENSDLKINLELEKKDNRKFQEREQTLEIIEKQVSNLASTNEKLKRELQGEAQKYENLKKLSTETAEDLIQSNNILNKIKAENKNFNERASQHMEQLDKLNSEINSKERTIRQLKLNEDSLNHQFKLEKDRMEQRVLNERKNLNEKIEFYEKEIDYFKDQLKHMTKENKNLSDKIRSYTDYNSIKSEVLHLRDKVVNYENENDTVRLQNISLQKQIERGLENLAMENKKFENAKFEYEELRNLSRESKEDLKKALEEMEGYADLLAAFENKIKEAEDAKSNAEKERDNAMNDVKVIRQRYINIIGDKSFA